MELTRRSLMVEQISVIKPNENRSLPCYLFGFIDDLVDPC